MKITNTHFDEAARDAIARGLGKPELVEEGVECIGADHRRFDLVMHWSDGLLLAEWEAKPLNVPPTTHYANLVQQSIQHLQRSAASSLEQLLQVATDAIRTLTGFDRRHGVPILPDGSGSVSAESKRAQIAPYLHLRYPAGDIPAQARRMYVLNAIRHVADVGDAPVAIEPAIVSASGKPLDLTHSILRSVSPVHIEYLKNLGVAASMSVSILVDGKLWGLIACHHMEPLSVPHAVRLSCTVLAANRLYQLVKKGSMSAPAEALTRFWATLRDKSRVRIEHPDLPAELQSATGELAAALWTRAVDLAQDQLAAAQLEAQHKAQLAVAGAQARQRQAEDERDRLRQELTGSAAALDGARSRIIELDQALAISIAATSTLQEQLRLGQQGEQHLQQALETARRDFASELDKLRADGTLAQERLRAAETRALLEIERERQAAARLQKELDAATRKAEQGSTRHRDEVQKLQAQVGNLRQQLGVLEGNLDALRTANARYVDEAAQARDQRDQLTLSLTHAAAKQRAPAAKPTAGPRKSSSPVRTSPRPRKS